MMQNTFINLIISGILIENMHIKPHQRNLGIKSFCYLSAIIMQKNVHALNSIIQLENKQIGT